MRIGETDTKVIRAFVDRKRMSGHKLSTDGRTLDGHWMGGSGIASWTTRGSHTLIELHDLGSRAAQTVHRRIVKVVERAGGPGKLHAHHHPGHSAARHEAGRNPLTIGERAKLKLGVLSPAAARAATSREKGLMSEHAAAIRKLQVNVEACKLCDKGAESKARKHLAKAKEALDALERLAKYRSGPEVAAANIKRWKAEVARLEAAVRGEAGPLSRRIEHEAKTVRMRSDEDEESGPRTVRSASLHEAGANPRVSHGRGNSHVRGPAMVDGKLKHRVDRALGRVGKGGR